MKWTLRHIGSIGAAATLLCCTNSGSPAAAPFAAATTDAASAQSARGNAGAGAAARSGGAAGRTETGAVARAGAAAMPTVVAAGSGAASGAGAGGSSNSSSGAAGAKADDVDSGMPSVEQPRSTGPGDWKAGDYPDELGSSNWLELSDLPGQNDMVRQYKVHVPPQYDPATPMPMLFCIHGLGQDALLFCRDGADMPAKSDAAGFILVMPNGYSNSWNAGTCCGDAATQKLEDVAFFRAMFAEVSKHLNIDLARVYATGLSNGGYMSYRLACEAADIFAAVAPGAGAIGMNDIGGGTATEGDWAACKPTQPVSVLHMHGTEDPLIDFKVQKLSLDRIAMLNGCQTTTHPALQPASAGDTTCVSYDCPAGIDVTGCTVEGGGHVWFGSKNCGTGVDAACAIVGANSTSLNSTDAAWSFLSSHWRP